MTFNDKEIQRNIRDRLSWDVRVDPVEIQVEVENGAVTLAGQVPTYVGRSAAFDAAWSVAGVREVRNGLTVKRLAESGAIPSDAEVQERISNLIAWNPSIDEKEISVKVADGLVRLEGAVNAHWKRDYVQELAANVLGVADIRNEIAVVPGMSMSDKDLAREVIAKLERNTLVDADQIEVRTDDGIVTLSGKVSTRTQRQAAVEATSRTLGVREVRDRIDFVMVA